MMIPRFTTLKKWADSILIDFPTDDVPILTDEDRWKDWGDLLVQEPSFSKSGAPGTSTYSDWNQWAQDVFLTMANF